MEGGSLQPVWPIRWRAHWHCGAQHLVYGQHSDGSWGFAQSAEEAKEYGLVDKVLENKTELLPETEEKSDS